MSMGLMGAKALLVFILFKKIIGLVLNGQMSIICIEL